MESRVYEALADADIIALASFQEKRKQEREEQEQCDRDRFRATLKARREEIKALHRREDEIRWLRVDRAFQAARLFGTPAMRRFVFSLAVAGVLMTGAALTTALLAGGVSQLALPSIQRARRLAAHMKQKRAGGRHNHDDDLETAYERTRRESTRAPHRSIRFSFDQIAKRDRVLAGLYAAPLLGPATPNERELAARHSERTSSMV